MFYLGSTDFSSLLAGCPAAGGDIAAYYATNSVAGASR
jgi:hypothetical protein